jgi:hypothetical protein
MADLIKDEFTDLKMSRQRKYQLRMRRDGRCTICGDKVAGACLCLKHLVAARERTRRRLGCKRRLKKTKSYQLEEQAVPRRTRVSPHH